MSTERESTRGTQGYLVHIKLLPLTKVAREFPGAGVVDYWRPLPAGAIIPVSLEYGGDGAWIKLASWAGFFSPHLYIGVGTLLLLIGWLLRGVKPAAAGRRHSGTAG